MSGEAEYEEQDGGESAPIVDLISGLALVALSVLALVWIIPANIDAEAGDYDVSPAFMPYLTAWIVLGLSVVLTTSALLRAQHHRQMVSWRGAVDPIIWALVCIALFSGLKTVGFLVVAPIITGLGLWVSGQRNWLVLGAVSIGVPVLIDFCAWQIFTVNLP